MAPSWCSDMPSEKRPLGVFDVHHGLHHAAHHLIHHPHHFSVGFLTVPFLSQPVICAISVSCSSMMI
jgi:hypothetical protein